jgi:hypothetical protein
MTTPKDGGQAFPRFNDDGMTLRDYFAGQALAGLLAGRYSESEDTDVARWSYKAADAVLAAREKGAQ